MRRSPVLLGLLAFLLSVPAFADAVDVAVNTPVLFGKGVPTLDLTINEPIAGFRVKLTRSDGKTLEVKGGGDRGVVRSIELHQPEGKFRYTGELVVFFPDAEKATLPLAFDAEVLAPLRMKIDRKDVDIENGKVVFSLTRPAKSVNVEVMTDDGMIVFDRMIPLEGAAGTPLEVTWPKTKKRVLKVRLEAYDIAGTSVGNELTEWQIAIPHQEPQFETGKWELLPSDKPKLDDAARRIREGIAEYGKYTEGLRLYIAGHTDTVAANDFNLKLSVNRAKAIGQYFRSKGIRIPIFYEGFGEEALKVPTPDNTDEAKNRRADYFLSLGEPEVQNPPFPPRWKQL